jgi:hypothetical protein
MREAHLVAVYKAFQLATKIAELLQIARSTVPRILINLRMMQDSHPVSEGVELGRE